MITEILYIVLRFIVLIAIQVLVLNNIQFGGYINPNLYVLFILLLPVRINRLLLLVVSLFTGLAIDMFTNTMGMHAAACLLTGYLRPGWLRVIAPRDGYEAESVPGIKKYGIRWFLLYSSVLVLVHHTLLFFIEVFRFSEFFSTLTRIILSSVATMIVIIITEYLFFKPEGRNK